MKRLLGWLCLAAGIYFLIPLCFGVWHIGMLLPAAVLFVSAVCLLHPASWRKLPRWLRRIIKTGIAAGLALAALLSTLMITAANNHPILENGSGTVIVPGCQVSGERPSVMLQNRIDAAYDYLVSHPDAFCVASGGMGPGETVTEADCIAQTLIQMGIAPERIYREQQSANTAENFQFSAEIIARQQLSPIAVIATDRFHEYRAAALARQYHLTPFAASCSSPWYLAPGYWCREMIAILAMVIL